MNKVKQLNNIYDHIGCTTIVKISSINAAMSYEAAKF